MAKPNTTAGDVREFAAENWDLFAEILGEILSDKVKHSWGRDSGYKRHFQSWQRLGVTILPNHFYSPIPDLNDPGDIGQRVPCHGIDWRTDCQLALLRVLSAFRSEYSDFSNRKPTDRGKYRYGGAFPKVDAEIAYAMTRWLKPQRIIEIGTGFSTLVLNEAVTRNRDEGYPCAFTSIDPYVSWSIGELSPGAVNHISQPVQEVPATTFQGLREGDLLFIDSSHVWRTGNDVDFEYFHLLPTLNPGVVVHIHDIFLPYAYPANWITHEHVFWNEQMILAAFLAFNSRFEVLLTNHYLAREHASALATFLPSLEHAGGGSFWIKSV